MEGSQLHPYPFHLRACEFEVIKNLQYALYPLHSASGLGLKISTIICNLNKLCTVLHVDLQPLHQPEKRNFFPQCHGKTSPIYMAQIHVTIAIHYTCFIQFISFWLMAALCNSELFKLLQHAGPLKSKPCMCCGT